MQFPKIPFLVGLDDESIAAVQSKLVHVSAQKGQILFREGEPGDALYIVASGAVGLSAADAHGHGVRRLSRVTSPNVFGEMALLSAEPRAATATALRDSELLRLSRFAFEEVIEDHARTLRYFTRELSARLNAAYGRRGFTHRPRVFALLPATDGVDAMSFAQRLAVTFDAAMSGKTACLSEQAVGLDWAGLRGDEAPYARTILVAEDPDTPWCQTCLRHADHVLLLALPGVAPWPGIKARTDAVRSDWIRLDLVMHQDPGIMLPRTPHPDTAALASGLRLHVQSGDPRSYARLSRLISGSARGLVLSGGGARAYAHIGVLKALEEAGMPVDIVGGTSMGAIVAANFAKNLHSNKVVEEASSYFFRKNILNDYTMPFHALIRGAKVDAALTSCFGDVEAEDLWLPFFCVSSNLTDATCTVHDRDPLVTALRASCAIPGLLPPVVSPRGVLVDGGMMNNLPSDVMAQLGRGPVLAIDVGTDRAFQERPRRSLTGPIFRWLLKSPDTMPGIVPLLLRAATVSSAAQAALAAETATVVLKPPLSGVDLLAWSTFRETADLGYRYTCDAIAAGRLDAWK